MRKLKHKDVVYVEGASPKTSHSLSIEKGKLTASGRIKRISVIVAVIGVLTLVAILVSPVPSKMTSVMEINNNNITSVAVVPPPVNSYANTSWTVLAVGPSVPSSTSISPVYDTGNDIVQFKDCMVWWSSNTTGIMISAYNLTSGVLTPACWYLATTEGSADMKVINDTLYAAYSYAQFPFYGGTIINSTDLVNWGTYLTESSLAMESFAMYTGPGPYSGDIMFGGYRSDGPGTYARIDCWFNNTDTFLFAGSVLGSDDVLYLQMLNSTMMVGGDVAPSDPIYTNDGGNWTDSYTGPSFLPYTAPYLFTWGSSVYTLNGTMWSVGYNTNTGNDNYGLGSWNGSVYNSYLFTTQFTPISIANTLVGGTQGLANSYMTGYPGNATIYRYFDNGSLGYKVMDTNGNDMAVVGMVYNSTTDTYYALISDHADGEMVLVQGKDNTSSLSCNMIGETTTLAGNSTTVYSNWSDGSRLSGFIIGTNATGSEVDQAWQPFSGSMANYTFMNPPAGKTIVVNISANDTNDNWASASFNYTTTQTPVKVSPVSVSINSSSSTDVTLGQQVGLSAFVTGGTGSYSYQWYINGNPISGATEPNYTFTPADAGSYNVYMAIQNASSANVEAKSNTISVTVNAAISNSSTGSTNGVTSSSTNESNSQIGGTSSTGQDQGVTATQGGSFGLTWITDFITIAAVALISLVLIRWHSKPKNTTGNAGFLPGQTP